MARSFSNVKAIKRLISKAINGRELSSAAASAPKGGVPTAMVKKTSEEVTQKAAWVPDPRTGFYRPENVVEEIDVAELRNLLLKKH